MFDQPVTKRPRPQGRRVAVALFSTVTVASVGFGALVAQANPGDAAGTIRSVAGRTVQFRQGGFGGDGGVATDAQLYNPRAIGFGPNGDVYIADALNQRVRKMDAQGIITSVAGSAAIDPNTQKPVVDANGEPTNKFDGDGGPATSAHLWEPHGLAVDSQGNLYIADSRNNRIRRVDATTGFISTFINQGGNPQTRFCPVGSPNGGNTCNVSDAGVKFPKNMFMGSNDTLYLADSGNHMIRKINLATNKITTVAGTNQGKRYGGDGARAVDARLNTPEGLWVTANSDIYIADSDNNLIRKVTADSGPEANWKISTVAGDVAAAQAAADAVGSDGKPNAGYPLVGDSRGDNDAATSAHLNGPRGIALDSLGNVYIAEEAGERIRRINPSGTIHTIAGDGVASPQGGGNSQIKGDPGPSPATEAQFHTMHDLNVDASGHLWIADSKNNRVRVIYSPAQAPTTTPPATPPTTQPGTPPPPPPASSKSGYWMLGNDGKIYAFGDAKHLGDASAALLPGTKAVHVEPTPTANGYWILDETGNVYAFNAPHAGGVSSLSSSPLGAREKATSLSATPSGKGYWIFTTKGRVLTFGDATHYGDMSAETLNGPVRGSIATPSGKGYYMVASDGGVFAFGDAKFRGSMGGKPLNKPVESLVPVRDGSGYWLVASDGGVFAFDAPFRGSMGGQPLNKPMVGMVRYGNGYIMVAADGGVFAFSDRPFAGSLGDRPPARPIAFAATLDS